MKTALKICLSVAFALTTMPLGVRADTFNYPEILNRGFTPIPILTTAGYRQSQVDDATKTAKIKSLCGKIQEMFKKYGWQEDPCGSVAWNAHLATANGHPLMFASFGSGSQTTLLVGGVHPDELTPIPIVFRFARHLAEHPDLFKGKGKDHRVVVAPLVNPDGFIRNVPTRTNANGVDPNRNFLTLDWYDKALKWWETGRKGNPRHFPGYFPNSEIETLFQVQLLDEFHPDKIITVHAPLGFLDYDGPGDGVKKGLSKTEIEAKEYAAAISRKSRDYRVVDYNFFPGSLGNFAGNERSIPTVTLELQTTDPGKVESYWKQFLPGLIQSFEYPYRKSLEGKDGKENATRFFTHYYKEASETEPSL